ncbi:non-ribosomal peptide synthetase [Kitasatospora sp. NPDC054939]
MQSSITAAYLARFRTVAASAGSAELLPLTGAQRRFLLTRRMDPQGRPDVVPLFFAFPRGTVDLDRLRLAALRTAARHPALRGRFETVRGTPVLRLDGPSAPEDRGTVGGTGGRVEVSRVEVAPGATAEEALRSALLDWRADGPVLRLLLAAGPDADEELLAVALDHAACDEQSLGIVTADLGTAYGELGTPSGSDRTSYGEDRTPSAVRTPYGRTPCDEDRTPSAVRTSYGARTSYGERTADSARTPCGDADEQRGDDGLAAYREAVDLQLAAEARAAGPAAHAHWAARLGVLAGGSPPAPTAAPGNAQAEQPQPTGMVTYRLPAASGAARGAVFPALLDAVSIAAHRLLGTERTLALGYPWGGRPPGAPPVLGCFLNTLVHPAPPVPGNGVRDLDALGESWWDDLDHADTPFDEVVHAARAGGARWSGALDGLLTFEDLQRRPPLTLDGVAGRETHLTGRPLAAPLAVSASHGDDLLVRLAWDRDRCTDAAAEAAFEDLLAALRHHLGGPA